MPSYFCWVRNLCFVLTALALLLANFVGGQEESPSQCIAYGGPCTSGSEMCCFNPMVSCLANSREQLSCLSPLDLTNLSPSLATAPLYQAITNATRRLLNLFPGLSSQLSPPSG